MDSQVGTMPCLAMQSHPIAISYHPNVVRMHRQAHTVAVVLWPAIVICNFCHAYHDLIRDSKGKIAENKYRHRKCAWKKAAAVARVPSTFQIEQTNWVNVNENEYLNANQSQHTTTTTPIRRWIYLAFNVDAATNKLWLGWQTPLLRFAQYLANAWPTIELMGFCCSLSPPPAKPSIHSMCAPFMVANILLEFTAKGYEHKRCVGCRHTAIIYLKSLAIAWIMSAIIASTVVEMIKGFLFRWSTHVSAFAGNPSCLLLLRRTPNADGLDYYW